MTSTIAPLYPSVPVCHDSVTVRHCAQYQDAETEGAKWNSVVILFIIYTHAFLTVTCQYVFGEKGPLLGESID